MSRDEQVEEPNQELFALNAASLKYLDRGAAAEVLKLALERAVRDCIDRPSDERARTVTMTFAIVPVKEVIDNVITCEGAHLAYKVRAKNPDYESRTIDCGVRENGMLVFNANCPTDHKQSTFLDTDEGED